jgi:hypothetical protein
VRFDDADTTLVADFDQTLEAIANLSCPSMDAVIRNILNPFLPAGPKGPALLHMEQIR